MNTLRIAQLSTPFIAVPPPDYGGTELVVYNLTEGLVKKGHKVTLFSTADSITSAKLQSTFKHALFYEEMEQLFSPSALKLFWLHSLPTLYHAVLPFEQAQQFDIIHNHIHYIGLFFASLTDKPTVHTYHGDLSTAAESPIEKMILEKYRHLPWTAISETQKKNCPIKLNFIDVIHHGVPIEKFTYQEDSQDYMVWLGRITPKKGVAEAIKVSKITKKKLVIAGVVHERDREFFLRKVKPQIDNQLISFVGALEFPKKIDLYKNAKLLLYPVTWEEPFGLVMIEAMACGTPVVAYANGAVTEIVRDNETGFLINSKEVNQTDFTIKKTGIEGLIEAINLMFSDSGLYKKFRKNSRIRVEEKFTVEKMTDKYLQVYQKVINQGPISNRL